MKNFLKLSFISIALIFSTTAGAMIVETNSVFNEDSGNSAESDDGSSIVLNSTEKYFNKEHAKGKEAVFLKKFIEKLTNNQYENLFSVPVSLDDVAADLKISDPKNLAFIKDWAMLKKAVDNGDHLYFFATSPELGRKDRQGYITINADNKVSSILFSVINY